MRAREAAIGVELEIDGEEPEQFVLSTSDELDGNETSASYMGYEIELLDVLPYPETGRDVADGDRCAEFVVSATHNRADAHGGQLPTLSQNPGTSLQRTLGIKQGGNPVGMTLWLHTLEGRTYSRESNDHSWMHRLSDELDDICTEEGVTKLSDFFDYSDVGFNHGDEVVAEFDDEDDDDERDDLDDAGLDAETGLGHGVDNMAWFDAEDGITTLTALRDVVEGSGLPDLEARERDDLLEELEDCLTRLEDTATRDGKFHLVVVE